ncbi:MAG: type II and III secretion system protein [Acidobacteria bacterium]|nr:MAG: type II and III secretion system protein [Acidobacteriota bacterium]
MSEPHLRELGRIAYGMGLGILLVLTPGVGWAQQATPEPQSLHVLLGKSVVVNMETRLRRVLVSNPATIEAVATSPTQVVVNAKTVGESSLILWDEAEHSRLLDVTVDLNVAPLRDALQLAYPNEPVQVQAEGDRLILSGTVSTQDVIDGVVKMAGVFSKDVINSMSLGEPVHDRQVSLAVKFAEVDRTKIQQWGINIFDLFEGNTFGDTSTQQFGAPTLSTPVSKNGGGSFAVTDILNIFLFRPDVNLAATIRLLEQKNVLQILAEPNLLALNGQPASFLAGGEFPFPVVQGGTNFSSVTIQFRQFGVNLHFTGFIAKDDTIRLKVAPEVSTLDFTNALSISGFLVPAISTRRAETEVELRDGQSFGIAGLLDHRAQLQMNKIPGIGDLPILGHLFRSHSVNRSDTELLVLVTPRIVDPLKSGGKPPAEPLAPIPFLDHLNYDKTLPAFSSGEKPAGAKKPK